MAAATTAHPSILPTMAPTGELPIDGEILLLSCVADSESVVT